MNRSAFDQWFCTALVLAAAALPPAQSLFAAPPQPPIITSGEFILADLDGDGLVDEASIDWITFDVAARTTVNFDALIYESIYAGGDLNGDGEITRADGGMVLFDSNQDVLAQIDDTPGDPGIGFYDGNFNYTFEEAGTYTLAISANGYFLTPENALAGYIDYRIVGPAFYAADGSPADHADWQLMLTVDHGSVSHVRVNTLGTPATPNPVEAAACTYLWPPDQQMVSVGLSVAPTQELLVFSNEPSENSADAALNANGGLLLRADRSGNGFGRVYLVVAVTRDGEGGESVDCCAVVVPHDKSKDANQTIEEEAAWAQMECLVNQAPPDGYKLIAP